MNFGKYSKMTLAVYLIIYAVYNMLVFIVFQERNAIFWTSYVFFMLAFILHMVCVFYSFKGRDVKAAFFGIPLVSLSNYFVLAELFVSLVFMIFRKSAGMKLCVAIQVILLAIYLIVSIVSLASKTYTSNVTEQITEDQRHIQNIRGELESLMQQCQHAEAREILRKAAEAARYADQRSGKSVEQIDRQIERTLEGIENAYNNGDLNELEQKCTEWTNELTNRNKILNING